MATNTKLSLKEFLRLPETEPASEYADGEVCQKAMPSLLHGMVQRLLAFVLTLYLRERGVGYAGSEVRCIFGPSGRERAYVPDLLFIAALPSGAAMNGPYFGAPDLAVEILSPEDRLTRVHRKLRFHLAHGVRLVWLVDPDRRTVTVMEPPNLTRVLAEHETLDGGTVLPGFACPVRDILPPQPPTAATSS